MNGNAPAGAGRFLPALAGLLCNTRSYMNFCNMITAGTYRTFPI